MAEVLDADESVKIKVASLDCIKGPYMGESDGTHGNWLLIGTKSSSGADYSNQDICATMVH